MGKTSATLPTKQLLILALCRFAEPIALTSVFPFLPEMIESFGVPTEQIARWAGITSAVFSIAQALTGVWWGRASDVFGRKAAILTGLSCTLASSVLFGFSQSLAGAIVARGCAGLANGNVGIIRTTVAELVPQRELQPRAFSIMPMVWQVGSIIGPIFGGVLVHPDEHFPGLFHHSALFRRYPFSLPGLVSAVFFLVGITAGLLFLRETLASRQGRKDYGLVLGSALTDCLSGRRPCRRGRVRSRTDAADESMPFLAPPGEGEGAMPSPKSDREFSRPETGGGRLGYRAVFTRQSTINLAAYSLLAMHSVAYDQFIAVFMHHPMQSLQDPAVQLPWQFSGGFGIDAGRIGALSTIYALFGLVVQFSVFPPLARQVGVLRCYRLTVLGFPMVYLLTPFTSLVGSSVGRQGTMLFLMLAKGWLGVFAFPCSVIMLTNSAESVQILGTLNGVSISLSAVGRAAGPALMGAAFSAGVSAGYMVAPWWLLALMATVAAIPVFWLTEMAGVDGNDDESDAGPGPYLDEDKERQVGSS